MAVSLSTPEAALSITYMSPGVEGIDHLGCPSRSCYLSRVVSPGTLQTTGGRARLLLSHFQTQVQGTCLSHMENMPDAYK